MRRSINKILVIRLSKQAKTMVSANNGYHKEVKENYYMETVLMQ